jgi:hypothetical protein
MANEIFRESRQSESDYISFLIPYGPKWTLRRTQAHIAEYMHNANNWYFRLETCHPPRAPVTPLAIGTMDEVLEKPINSGVIANFQFSIQDGLDLAHFVHIDSEKMWVTENPGAQKSRKSRPLLTGSFQPTRRTRSEWEKGAYEHSTTSSKSTKSRR